MTERQVGVNQSLRGTVTLTSLPSVPLPTNCTYPYNIYSISIHNIYTVSTHYLHSNTQYLHCIYTASTTVSSHPARWPWPACCLSWWWRAGGRAAPAPATTSPHPASPLSCSLLSLLLRLHWVCLSLGPAALLSPEMTAPIRGQTLDSRHGNLNLADPGPGLQLQAWEWLVLL